MFGFFKKSVVAPKKKSNDGEIKSSKKGKRFGGYAVNFKDQKETLEDLFGNKPITTPEMTKKLWSHIKKNNLGGR